MNPDDEVCHCFHVTRRKLENFIRLRHVKRAEQLSECLGAGTGCGGCRPDLRALLTTTVDAKDSTGTTASN